MTGCSRCPKVYPLPDIKVGDTVECQVGFPLHLPEALLEELRVLGDNPDFQLAVTAGTKGEVTELDDHYVRVEVVLPTSPAGQTPWFCKQLRGDFAYYWIPSS